MLLIETVYAQAVASDKTASKGSEFVANTFDFMTRIFIVIVILVVSLIIARIVLSRILEAVQRNQKDGEEHKEVLVLSGRLIYVIFTVIGLAIGLGVTNLAGELTWLFGAIGLGVGFAFQTIFGNYVAGVTLLVNRKMKMGELVQINGFQGIITNIGTRAVTLHDLVDGTDIYVPNLDFFNKNVRVMTANPFRRVWVEIGVGYDTNFQQANEKIFNILKRYSDVEQEPPPDIIVDQIKDSVVNIQVRWWLKSNKRWWSLRSDILRDIFVELQEIGVDISFPIRTLRIDSRESDGLYDYMKKETIRSYEGSGIRPGSYKK